MKKYQIKTQEGKIFTVKSNNDMELRAKVRKSKFKVIEIKELKREDYFLNSKIKTPVLILLFKELSLLLAAGVNLNEALDELFNSNENKEIRICLKDVKENLQHGQSPSLSFKNSFFGLNKSEIALIEMGENTGNFSFVFSKICELREKRLDDIKRLKRAVNYPLFVFIALVFAFISLMFLVIPQFKNIFEDFGITLPLLTRFMLNIFDFLENFYLVIVFIVVLGVLSFIYFYKTNPVFQYFCHALWLKIPLLNKMIFYNEFTNFFLVFSLLLKSGINVSYALELSNSSLRNKFLLKKCSFILDFSKQGLELSEAFKKVNLFETAVITMLNIAMKSAKLDLMSEKISYYYETKQRDIVDKFLAFLEPLMTIFVAVLVLFLALGIFMPMWELNSSINF